MVYTGVQCVTVGPDETIVEVHDGSTGACSLRLTPMAVQALLEALGQAPVWIRKRIAALGRPSTPSTAWNPMIDGLHEYTLRLTTWEGLQFAAGLDAGPAGAVATGRDGNAYRPSHRP